MINRKSLTTDMEGLQNVAQWFVDAMGEKKIFAFNGKMGVGKTTFIKAVCELMGVTDVINSPTFAIVNEYRCTGSGKRLIYHFDFYRLSGENGRQEAEDIGVEEYFFSDAICFIEWPEAVDGMLPEDAVTVDIEENQDGSRTITVHY